MKSENDLRITGVVVSDVQADPGHAHLRFRLEHSFGGRKKPLYISCVLILREESTLPVPRKGDQVRIRAYLRMHSGLLEAVVKTLLIE